jgi:hypothetical protein
MRSRTLGFTAKRERIFGVIKKADSEKVPTLSYGTVLRREDFGFLLFDPRTSVVLRTNPVGAEIIQNCDGKKRTAEIGEVISDAFEVEAETALRDVNGFIRCLSDLGLVEYV